MLGSPTCAHALVAILLALASADCTCAGDEPSPQAPDESTVNSHSPIDPALPGIAAPDTNLERVLRAAVAERGPDYKPRTEHLQPDGSPTYVNRLIRESSPYLLQHAHNPVNFFPWGPEALQRATQEGKPILLSIGYSTCHWCHVMERESFEDEEIAAYLNAHYISIKVDREERPDLDDVYMTAVQLLTGRGGWPMTVFLTPDLQPFFGGTYFPPRDGDRGAGTGFLTILKVLHQKFIDEPKTIAEHADQLSQAMADSAQPRRPGAVPGHAPIEAAARALGRRFDPVHGGFGKAPKFPQPAQLDLLLRYYRRTGDAGALKMVLRTLRGMAAGGMHDLVGGGFHRYSTDREWLVPHFEKMLYDNALLTHAYLDGFQATGDVELRRVVESTLDYVRREMTSPQGDFYSATDADSDTPTGHQEEGYHFTWTPEELRAALDADEWELLQATYAVSDRGNFEGRTILTQARPREAVAEDLGLRLEDLHTRLATVHGKLYSARSERPYPGRDDKVLTAWNALMIGAFAQAGFVLGRKDYVAAAKRAEQAVYDDLRDEQGRLLRSRLSGSTHASSTLAFLEDHAFLIEAELNLFEATWELIHLERAMTLQRAQDDHFWDVADGGYFMTRNDQEELLVRDKPSYDGATPSGNAVAAMNLLRLADLTSDPAYRAQAEKLFSAFAQGLTEQPLAHTHMLAALDRYLDVPREVIVVRPVTEAQAALLDAVRSTYLPNRVVVSLRNDAVEAMAEAVPMVGGKVALDGHTTAYVCERGRCQLPTSSTQELAQQLSKVNRVSPAPEGLRINGPQQNLTGN